MVAVALAVLVAAGWSALRPDDSTASDPAPISTGTDPVGDASFTGFETITFTFDGRAARPVQTARFQVQRSGSGLTIGVSTVVGDGGDATTILRRATSGRPWLYSPEANLQLALVPGYARNVTSLGPATIQVAYLAAVDMAAIAIEHDPTNAAEEFFWSDYSGVVRNSSGAAVPSATVLAGSTAITVFEDADLGVWGYLDGVVRVVRPIDSRPAATLEAVTRRHWLGMLPAGATRLKVDADDSVTWGAAPLGTTGRLVVAGYTGDSGKGRAGVRSVSYTDASGRRHTVRA